jgi:hypothetical protein
LVKHGEHRHHSCTLALAALLLVGAALMMALRPARAGEGKRV